MKLLVLVLGILLCQTTNVSCFEFLDYMMAKLNEYGGIITKTFQDIGYKIKTFIYGERRPNTNVPVRSAKIPKKFPESKFSKIGANPTILLSTPQIAATHGKKVESHVIKTKDGYLLTLHRIVLDQSSNKRSDTVLLHHGLLGSSADWLLLGANQSLPYILSSLGYDVWLINTRGNYYSRGHIEMKVDCVEFWRFSFHEMGLYDLSATLEYIRKVKNNTDLINFIGHSMGASTLLVLLSSIPIYNKYFKIAILIAPLVYMNNIKGPLKTSLLLEESEEFLPNRKVPNNIASNNCTGLDIFCTNPLFFLSGIPDYTNWTDSFMSTLIYHIPAGGSSDTIKHYQQMAASGTFHKFGDMFTEYPLSEVTVPIATLSSGDDWLASASDVLKFYFSLKKPVDNYVIYNRNISHTDFVWGSKANTLIFPRILEYLKKADKFVSTTTERYDKFLSTTTEIYEID